MRLNRQHKWNVYDVTRSSPLGVKKRKSINIASHAGSNSCKRVVNAADAVWGLCGHVFTPAYVVIALCIALYARQVGSTNIVGHAGDFQHSQKKSY